MKVTAILASHDRRDRTVACLESYFAQEAGAAGTLDLDAVLVDDRSSDGTAGAVRERFPQATVIPGTGELYWAGAMAIAEREAIARDPDYLLWLNDDVVLDRDSLATLIQTCRQAAGPSLAIGALRDPDSGDLTYSGVRRPGRHPLRLELVHPEDRPVPVETFNGNVVLVPRATSRIVGPLDGAFVHAAADYDYGLRASGAGVANLLAPGTMGACRRDGPEEPWMAPSLSIKRRAALLFGPKGAPPAARGRYLRRHGGRAWVVYWMAPYVRALLAAVRPSRSG